jgi:hypothetical protein
MFPVSFVYIDESGTAGLDSTQHFFVLAATVIKVDQCRAIQEKLTKLKQEYFHTIRPEEIEIKGRNIEQAKDFFEHINLDTRREIVKRLFELLFAHNISLFATVFSKEEESVRRLNMPPDDVYRYAYKNLIIRLNEFLESKNEFGMLFVDSQASSVRSHLKDDRLVRFHQECLNEVTQAGKQIRIVEYPVFVQSEFFAAAQLADLCAYHIFRAMQIHYGQPYLQNLRAGNTRFMPPIDHGLFQNSDFLDSFFSHVEVNLPAMAKILKRSGGIEKLP